MRLLPLHVLGSQFQTRLQTFRNDCAFSWNFIPQDSSLYSKLDRFNNTKNFIAILHDSLGGNGGADEISSELPSEA